MSRLKVVVFPSDLGWIATAWRNNRLHRVTFAHSNPQQAVKQVETEGAQIVAAQGKMQRLASRLQAFAKGDRQDDFVDVQLDTDELTEFQIKVTQRCREISSGQTMSYGELARAAGYPGAARAVGSVMANNRWPLIIPCHRVVAAHGLGGFSARHGLRMKRRLLSCEPSTLSTES